MLKDPKTFIKEYDSNVGKVGFIETTRANRPTGLRKPYEYISTRGKFDDFYAKLQTYLKQYPSGDDGFQYLSASKRGKTRGVKFNIFFLAWHEDVSEKQWLEVCEATQKMLHDYLGPDADIYVEPWDTKAKFQAQFETYIFFEESGS